jgi:hypothetical protein
MMLKRIKLAGLINSVGCALLFLCAVLPAHAAVEAEGPRWLSFKKFSGFLNFQYQQTDETNTSEGDVQYDITRGFLEGGVQVSTTGSIYHPNLLTFTVDANIVGNRTKNTLISDESIHNSINNTYNIRVHFFKKKRINVEFFALSHYTTAERRFRGRFFSKHKRIGLTVNSDTKVLPFTLSVYDNRNAIDALTYSERDEKSRNIDFRTNIFRGLRTNSFLTLKNKNYSESVYNVDYDTLELLFNFHHNYGKRSLNNVVSTLSYNKMKGNYNFELLRFLTNFQYFFKEHLDLRGTYTLTKDKAYEHSITRHDASVTLTHRLFQSLTTSVTAGGRIEDSSLQRRDTLIGVFNFNYRKKIPTGQIGIFFSQRYENSDNTSRSDIQREIEYFEFSFSDTVTLVRPGIKMDTIQVTDREFTRVYIPEIDYQVNIINSVVHITRLPGGDIPEDGLIAIHYEFLAYPDYGLKSRFRQINFSLGFLRYLQVFYNETLNDHNVTSEFVTPLFDSYTRRIGGARFSTRYLSGEYALEDYDSVFSGYKATHLRGNAAVTLFKRLQLAASLSLSHLKYETGVLYNKFRTYSGNINLNLSARFSARAVYRRIRYETAEYFRDRESILFKVRWDFRRIILEAYYEHVFDGYQLDERLHDFFSIAIKRKFGK